MTSIALHEEQGTRDDVLSRSGSQSEAVRTRTTDEIGALGQRRGEPSLLVDRHEGAVRVSVIGEVAHARGPRVLMRELDLVRRRLPTGTSRVEVDLGGVDLVTVEVVVVLCLQRRLLGTDHVELFLRVGPDVAIDGAASRLLPTVDLTCPAPRRLAARSTLQPDPPTYDPSAGGPR